MNKDWCKISLFFLFCIAGIGTFLRALPFLDLPINYSNLVHAHSHVAFQGWVYTALLLLVPHLFLNQHQIKKGRYELQFKITIPLIIAILIAFLIEGYGLYSIVLSTLFQGMNYWFIFRFFKDTKSSDKNDVPVKFVKIGFWFGILSSLAPYFVGYLSAKDLSHTESYESAIYFFLHFQYNGWFLFTIIGIIFKIFERYNISFNKSRLRLFLILLTISSVLTYLHSLLGMSFRSLIVVPAAVGAVLQLIGVVVLLGLLKELHAKSFFQDSNWTGIFMLTALVSFALKSLLQLITVFPAMQYYAFGNRSFIMAYRRIMTRLAFYPGNAFNNYI